MEESKLKNIVANKSLVLQDYLSLGYVFLLVVGLFHETIYYSFLGVNILEFSSLLDVLMCPVSVITGNLVLGLAVVICVVGVLFATTLLPKHYQKLAKKEKYQSGKRKEKLDKSIAALKAKNSTLIFTVFYVFSMYVGLGVGRGTGTRSKINKEEIKLTHELVFKDGEREKIKMLGKNSLYIFYVTQEKREVTIAPIDGNVKKISKLKKEE